MLEDYYLTDHFTLFDLSVTEIRDLQEINKREAAAYANNLLRLAETLLEPIWAQFGPLTVTSGFRCLELNSIVGGAPASQHRDGTAGDINQARRRDGQGRKAIIDWLLKSGLKWHQLLDEHDCLHISLPTGNNDMQTAWAERDPSSGLWIKKTLNFEVG